MLAFGFGMIVGFFLATLLWGFMSMASESSRQEEALEQARRVAQSFQPADPNAADLNPKEKTPCAES
jgi:flagellar basal body-associated protein FliL